MEQSFAFNHDELWLTQDSTSTSTQKPTDELYASFRQNFPNVGPQNTTTTTTSSEAPGHTAAAMNSGLTETSLQPSRQFGDHNDDKDNDGADNWRFTPSMLDSNAFSFGNFGNQGYYTPTPGGMNTVYHNQAAGDLHTPGMSFQLGTPLSLSLAESSMNASAFDPHGFQPHMFHPNQPFQTSMFEQQHHHEHHQQQSQQQHQQPTYHPSMLVHQDSGYDAMDGSPDNDTDRHAGSEFEPPGSASLVHNASQHMTGQMAPLGDSFRYHVTLNAPTAMTRHPDEIPITYLNKGQAYTVSIVDSTPSAPASTPLKYRTVIRISFEDEQQRQRPSACWQLWKEGRGLSESHQRGGKLQAVEFVDPHPGAEEDPRRPRIELESASFDCFAVNWTPSIATSSSECSIAVRFNFLSTDFSHSKGVKGIPVRLCAKTEIVSAATIEDPAPDPEVCFCKVKLFRDHGAERKLSNDVAHVKKTIDKLKQQIAQAEAGIKDSNKRKRTASMAGKISDRPAKVNKHKRTWSISSQGSGGRPAIEDDLHQKLAAVQDMFTSTRPVSVLYLKGLEEDDPDLFPVALPGGTTDLTKIELQRTQSWDRRQSENVSPTGSSVGSPELGSRTNTGFRVPQPKLSRTNTGNWPLSATLPATNFSAALEQARVDPVKIKRKDSEMAGSEDLEVVGVDPSYAPPPEQLVKPVACFYILVKGRQNGSNDNYYRAVYLMNRTLNDLLSAVASKCEVDPSCIKRTLRITRGLEILVDEEVVRELPEGQDMVIEFKPCPSLEQEHEIKQETLRPNVEPSPSVTPMQNEPLEMRLIF